MQISLLFSYDEWKRFLQKVVEWASQLISGTSNLQVDYEKLNGILSGTGKCSSSTIDVQPVFIPERADNVSSCISGITSTTTIEEVCMLYFTFPTLTQL